MAAADRGGRSLLRQQTQGVDHPLPRDLLLAQQGSEFLWRIGGRPVVDPFDPLSHIGDLLDRAHIARVTFWGVGDGDSWLNNWPVQGRTSYPLLFDRNGKPKPAFDAVVRTAQEAGK